MISTCLQFLLVSMVMAAGIASESPEAGSKTHANLRRALLTPPRDVYSMTITNKLSVAVNSTFTFTKGTNIHEMMIEKKQIAPGASFTSGPYEYKEGTATFRYVLQMVKVKNLPAGAGYSEQQALSLEAPFEGVTGVTPLMELHVLPKESDGRGEKLGSLLLKAPVVPAV
ncbi:Hypothetical protein NocV09_00403970 [Nannochloropsis oceanica]